MQQLPEGLEHVRTTDVFDQDHHPAGLLRAHQVADGVWGRLLVHSGQLSFVFEDSPGDVMVAAEGDSIVIPPARRHHVVIDGPATFAIEFHREPAAAKPTPGDESTGLAPV